MASDSQITLPSGFVLGTSTASYQIEGAWQEDGKGPSIWDTFTAEPGRVVDGSTGRVACDHYHRFCEDVALMGELGTGGYRFSIAWPRIQPTGEGAANRAGLDFYDSLVDELLAHDIAPMATLYHWDLPQALQDAGGWQHRDTTERFAEYAAIVADRLADRVAYWVPVNEPNVVTLLGHGVGSHAPGQALGLGCLPVAHHLNLAHGRAVQVLRAAGAKQVGTANNHAPMWPITESEADAAAAEGFDMLWNRLFADPMLLGRYPDPLAQMLPIQDGDLEVIGQPLDFYGMNYYNPMAVGAPTEDEAASGMPFRIGEVTGYPTTDFGWPIVPAGLTEMLTLLHDRYPDLPPVHITENGCSCADLDDTMRVGYLDGHLRAVADAIAKGIPVHGYWCWSLMDNFEWAEGYTQRFGLVHVDFESLQRTPRTSFRWYADLARSLRAPGAGGQ